jgi:hypothetical protein
MIETTCLQFQIFNLVLIFFLGHNRNGHHDGHGHHNGQAILSAKTILGTFTVYCLIYSKIGQEL